jgi:transposase
MYELAKLEITTKSRKLENKKGRPRKNEEVQTFYLVEAEIKHIRRKYRKEEQS